MNCFTKYILQQLFVGMILVTTSLTCIIWLTQSLRFIEMIVNRGLSAGMFAYLTALLLPNFLVIVLPISLFLVIIFIYSKLITDRELLVMRASGLSQFALAKPALILALLVVGFGYLLNLYLVPQSYTEFRKLQWDIRYNYAHILLREGEFNQVANGITVYVRQRTKDGQLLGLLVHDQRKKDSHFTLMATKGAMVDNEKGARVIMFDGNRQSVDRTTNKMSILYFDYYAFDLASTGVTTMARYREPRERSIDELFNIEALNPEMNKKEYGKFIVEAHKRLVSPLTSLGFALIALSCLIASSFSRRTQSRQVILAIFIMVALQGSALGLENLVAKQLEFLPLLYILGAGPIVLGFLFMIFWQSRGRKWPYFLPA